MAAMDAIRSCLQKYFQFSGRSLRPEFWWFYGFLVVGSAALQMLDEALFGKWGYFALPLTYLFGAVTFIPSIAVGFRRLHDTGRSGWLFLLPGAIALCGIVVAFAVFVRILGLSPETMQANSEVLAVATVAPALIGALVAVLAVGVQTYWLLRPSDPGPNRYGPPPAV